MPDSFDFFRLFIHPCDDIYCITMIKPLGHRIFFLEKYDDDDKDNDHEDD